MTDTADENIFGEEDPELGDLDLGEDEPAAEVPTATSEAPALEAAATPVAPAEPAAPAEPSIADIALGALKAAWVESAKSEASLADFSNIGLTGFDEAAREKFMDEARASHAEQLGRMEALGFKYAPKEAEVEAREAAQKAAWGATGPGSGATAGEQVAGEIAEAVQNGDTRSVIATMIGKAGLGDFTMKGRKPA